MTSSRQARWCALGILGTTNSALLIGLFMFLAFVPHQTVVDLGWHMAQGRWIVQHFRPYDQDKFNYPNMNHSVIDEYPIFQVILYLSSTIGKFGPEVLGSMGYGLLIGLNLRGMGPRNSLPRPVSLYMAFVGLAGLMIGIELRPHLITYLCITLFGLFLMANHKPKRLRVLWPLLLLQAIWVNSHSGFIIGPAMVGLFGFERIVRAGFRSWRKGWVDRSELWQTACLWALAFAVDLIACLLNPYGFERVYLPFYQHDMVSLRAYVSEMLPLGEPFLGLYQELTLICVCILGTWVFRVRQVCIAWVVLSLAFYEEALSVQKYWPIFALFLPLIAISTVALKQKDLESLEPRPLEKGIEAVISFCCIAGLIAAWALVLNPTVSFSPLASWADFNSGHTRLPVEAIEWMREHQLEGRIFHRAEYGGLLQELGYIGGEVYGDTGFGKYSPDMIHELELVGDRVSYAKRALDWYHPDIVLCGNYSQLWPGFLRTAGWRLVHYTPSGSVWLRPGFRTDLPTVPIEEVADCFRKDLAEQGRGSDLAAFARNLIALQSLGAEDEAFTQVQALPPSQHAQGFYWDLAAILFGMDPPLSPSHRMALIQEAEKLGENHPELEQTTRSFLAQAYLIAGDRRSALKEAGGLKEPTGSIAEFLVEEAIDKGDWAAATRLIARTQLFDLRSGRYYQLKAQCEDHAGMTRAAEEDWNLAIYSWPDDPQIRALAKGFAFRMNAPRLRQKLDDSLRFYAE